MIVSATLPNEDLYALTWNGVAWTLALSLDPAEVNTVDLDIPILGGVWQPEYLCFCAYADVAGAFSLRLLEKDTGLELFSGSSAAVVAGSPPVLSGRVRYPADTVQVEVTSTAGSVETVTFLYGYQR